MARIRTIKPEFFTSLSIANLTPLARLTFIGLWTHVDDEGRCIDDARLIKAAVSPLDRTVPAIKGDLDALESEGLIVRYQAAGRRLLQIRAWREHQRINRPTKSKFPPPEGMSPHAPLTEDSLSPHDRKGKEGNREGNLSLVQTSSQSGKQRVDEDGLTRIKQALGSGCTEKHATKTTEFILAKAPVDVKHPVNYVLKAIREEPELYAYRRGNPTKDTCCRQPGHGGEWADACRACAIDAKVGPA